MNALYIADLCLIKPKKKKTIKRLDIKNDNVGRVRELSATGRS